MFKRCLLIIVVLLFYLTTKADSALAGTFSFGGTINGSDPTMPVVSISTPNCTSQGVTPVHYEVNSIPSNTGGKHTFTLTSTGNFASMYLYVDSFNPASPLTNCVAATNSGSPKTFNYTLDASRSYFVVVFDDTFTQLGGSYQLTITDGLGCPNIDNRLNSACDNPDQAAAVYCREGSIVVYAVNDGKGYPAFTVTSEELDKFSGNPARNVLIKQNLGARLYKLTSGEYQVNRVKPDGKEYAFIFRGC